MENGFDDLRKTTDSIVDDIDKQAVKNFEMNLQINNYKSELRHALHRMEQHTYCPGQVPANCLDKKGQQEFDIEALTPKKEVVPQPEVKEIHGEDCHCSKCCPNPNPNFFQKNKFVILLGILWVAIIILALGWSPGGEVFEAMQTSYVELIVNFFKMGLFAIAGIATYNLVKKKDE